VVAPLFGTRGELSPLFAEAKRHGLRVIEDGAQAFAGRDWTGHPEADVTLFSFGPLKFATALGGALVHVRDPALLARMREIEAGWPVFSHAAYALRVLKFAGLKLVSTRPALAVLAGALRLAGRDYEDVVSEPLRGVASLGSPEAIRRRCPAALLALLERRVLAFGPERLAPRVVAGRRLLALLEGSVRCPAASSAVHHFWVFPVLVDDPAAVMQALRRAGFDASTLRRSATLAAPEGRPELEPQVAREALAHLLVLPCHEGMPERELRRQAAELRRACAASACISGPRCA
jgi:dTDP-4-amino-4,6-dideoxygalactose transaminase